ncbi:probable gamma-secretase subunit PEN-2 [Punica granatum]|uniref:Uncharacterized protein n=2 Tax=Punica granatum TaxID=22663 RepID=A0A2I0IEZ2_PUNGR|nr:probable gamma-secretase subunit PEN-2 [Punica granatum]PKI42240.1 hypothetical protein CRG98_037356 [Punica granatum]
MEASRSPPADTTIRNPNPNPNPTSIAAVGPVWPTVDGPLGLSEEDAVSYARRFYKFGFALLPWLWAVNCFYFWPVLRHKRSFPQIRCYVLGSAIGFTAFTILLCSWVLTFAIGGESLFGTAWDKLVMYNLADKWGLTGWD